MNFLYDYSESNFNYSSFDASYSGKVLLYFDSISFTFWVSIITLSLLKCLVNYSKAYLSSCFMLTTFLIDLKIDAIGYRLSL